FTGYIHRFRTIVQVAVTTGGVLTLQGGGAVYNTQSYLDTTSFPGAAQGDTPFLPSVQTLNVQNWANTAPASPGIVTLPNHGLVPGQAVKAGGTVPTGFASGTTYYVSAYGFSANAFNLASSIANALSGVSITASGSASTTGTLQTGQQGIIPVTNCALTVPNSAAAGLVLDSGIVPAGDPTNLVVGGQALTVLVDAAFATAGEVNIEIDFRSNR
ncbi:MAG: hypothetical protein ACREP9_19655, partial [Candidatus Dormibacteraceae bacterium]